MSNFVNSRSENFNKNSDPSQGISIVIPRVFNNLNWRNIKHIFVNANFGFVERVDVIPKGSHKTAYVHFAAGKWNMRSYEARQFLTKLQDGEEVQFVYDHPWYWKISISNSRRATEAPKPSGRRKKILDLSEKEGVYIFKPIQILNPVKPLKPLNPLNSKKSSSPNDTELLKKKHKNQNKLSFKRNDPIQARMCEHINSTTNLTITIPED
tara:strand:- start:1193 stop:1822 length:630 start_codon:yes stop_codon:yes gene_type:complete